METIKTWVKLENGYKINQNFKAKNPYKEYFI